MVMSSCWWIGCLSRLSGSPRSRVMLRRTWSLLWRVRELDRVGSNAAHEAANFGRRRVDPAVIDARRNVACVMCW